MILFEIPGYYTADDGNPENPQYYQIAAPIRISWVAEAFVVEYQDGNAAWRRAWSGLEIGFTRSYAGLVSDKILCVDGFSHKFVWQSEYPFASKIATTGRCNITPPPQTIVTRVTPVPQQRPNTPDGAVIFDVLPYRPIRIRLYVSGTTPLDENHLFAEQEQTSGFQFTGLYPGTYFWKAWAYAEDTGEEVLMQTGPPVVVGRARPADWGLYAYTGLESVRGVKWRLEIRRRGFTGNPRETCLAEPFMQAAWRGEGGDLLIPHITSMSVDFTLKAEGLRDWTVLFTNDEREYYVRITRNGSLWFSGFILPGLSSQSHIDAMHPAGFTAADGLGILKEKTFALAGTWTLAQVVEYCVRNANTEAPVHWRTSWQADGLPLSALKIDCAAFHEAKDCREVLVRILETFGGRIFMQDGVFVIDQPFGQQDGAESISGCTIGGVSENIVLAGDSSIEVYPAEPGIKIIETMEQVPLLFSDFTQDEEWKQAPGDWLNFIREVPSRWAYIPDFGWDYGLMRTKDGLALRVSSDQPVFQDNLTYSTGVLSWDDSVSFLLAIRCNMARYEYPLVFSFAIEWSGWWLASDAKSWQRSRQYVEYVFSEAEMGKDIDIRLETPVLPLAADAPVRVILRRPYDRQRRIWYSDSMPFTLKQVTLQPLGLGAAFPASRIHVSQFRPGKLREVPAGLGGNRGAGPALNERLLYPYALQATSWTDESGLSVRNASDLLHRLAAFVLGKNRERLNAVITGRYDYGHHLVIRPDADSRYLCESLSLDLHADRYSGTFVLLSGLFPSPLYRLMEDGTLHVKEGVEELASFFETYTYDDLL